MGFGRELEKKAWAMPVLVVYGNVEKITQGCDKKFGSADGFTFQGSAITCAS